jgi:hypothetical protein
MREKSFREVRKEKGLAKAVLLKAAHEVFKADKEEKRAVQEYKDNFKKSLQERNYGSAVEYSTKEFGRILGITSVRRAIGAGIVAGSLIYGLSLLSCEPKEYSLIEQVQTSEIRGE